MVKAHWLYFRIIEVLLTSHCMWCTNCIPGHDDVLVQITISCFYETRQTFTQRSGNTSYMQGLNYQIRYSQECVIIKITDIMMIEAAIIVFFMSWLFELPHDKTNKMTSAPSKDSDQPPSLIRVFAVRMKLSYPLSAQRRLWSECADAQADLSFAGRTGHFVGFVMSQLNYLWHHTACGAQTIPGHDDVSSDSHFLLIWG